MADLSVGGCVGGWLSHDLSRPGPRGLELLDRRVAVGSESARESERLMKIDRGEIEVNVCCFALFREDAISLLSLCSSIASHLIESLLLLLLSLLLLLLQSGSMGRGRRGGGGGGGASGRTSRGGKGNAPRLWQSKAVDDEERTLGR